MAASPFFISPELTAIAVMYTQANLIADEVLPRVPVVTESFVYNKYALGDAFTAPETLVGRKSAPNQVEFASTPVTATTQDHGLDAPIPNKDLLAWREAKAAGLTKAADPLARATKMLTQLMVTRREKRTADLVFNAASYGASNQATLSGTSQWSDYANSDPVPTILAALDAMIMRPNYAIFGRKVATKLATHPAIIKAVYGVASQKGVVSMSMLAEVLQVEKILIGEGWLNTAAKGQVPNMTRIWGNHAAFVCRNVEADTQYGVSFGLTAQWGDRVAGTIVDPDIGLRGGERVRTGEAVIELVTANDLGYFFQNAVA